MEADASITVMDTAPESCEHGPASAGTQTTSCLPSEGDVNGPDRQGRRAGQALLMPRDARAKQNAQFLRDVSEDIGFLDAGRFSLEAMPFVCECARFGCGAPVYLTVDEFRNVRSTPGHYVTIPAHVDAERERVVVSTGRYAVVSEIEAGGAGTRTRP